jgi:hypothetical protein
MRQQTSSDAQQPQAGESQAAALVSAPLLSHAENSTRHAALTWRQSLTALPVSGRCDFRPILLLTLAALYTLFCAARSLLFSSPFRSCASLQESRCRPLDNCGPPTSSPPASTPPLPPHRPLDSPLRSIATVSEDCSEAAGASGCGSAPWINGHRKSCRSACPSPRSACPRRSSSRV